MLESGNSTLTESLRLNKNLNQAQEIQNRLQQHRLQGQAKKRKQPVDNLLKSGSNPPPLTHRDPNRPKQNNMGGNSTRTSAQTINVDKNQYKKLQDDCKKYKHAARSVDDLNRAKEEALAQAMDAEKRIQQLLKENGELKARLKKLAKGKSAKAAAKIMQATDILKEIEKFARGLLFRTVKFTHSTKHLEKATQKTWLSIKDEMKLESPPQKLDEKKFSEIYSSAVAKFISKERQYLQTRGQDAARGTNLPCVCYFLFLLCPKWFFFRQIPRIPTPNERYEMFLDLVLFYP